MTIKWLMEHTGIPVLTILFFMLLSYESLAQSPDNQNYVIALAERIDVLSTGKRHNSLFFVFRVTETLKGKTEDTMVVSQELYNDFGGISVRLKSDSGQMIIKYTSVNGDEPETGSLPSRLKDYPQIRLIWVAEAGRQKSLQRLERLLSRRYHKTEINLLEERNGKLYFRSGEKLLQALEKDNEWEIILLSE